MIRAGIAYRAPLAAWIAEKPPEVGCLEVTAEHFFDDGALLPQLARDFPLFVHGLGLSLGTPGPLDQDVLDRFARVVELADPAWISEHVAFTRTHEVDLGHLNPVVPSRESADLIAEHVQQVVERCRRPLILENITAHLRLDGELRETEFLNRVCESAGCGLLLDVTNLFINSRNHRFDPLEWLREIDPRFIVQLHVVGYGVKSGRYVDHHAAPIQDELFDLVAAVAAHATVQAAIVERDAAFPPTDQLAAELVRLESILAGA